MRTLQMTGLSFVDIVGSDSESFLYLFLQILSWVNI